MRQLYYIRRGKLEWRESPDYIIQNSDQAIVKSIVAGRCDLNYFIALGATPFQAPFAIGHESVGEVVEVGANVKRVKVGDRVVVPFHISCGHCHNCKRGIVAFCNSVPHGATYGLKDFGDFGGSVSDLLLIPYADSMLHIIPESVSSVAAVACSDNLADAWRTIVPYINPSEKKPILVVGGTSIGLYTVMIAKAFNQEISYLDSDKTRLEMAEALGAKCILFDDNAKLGKYPITVDTGINEKGLHTAIRAVEPGGVCTTTGIYFSDVKIPYMDMYNTDITLKIGRAEAGTFIPEILNFISTKKIEPEKIITKIVDWKDAETGYKEKTTKLVVVRN